MPAYQRPPTVSDDYRAVEIYRIAADVIFDQGFHATSMGDIADAVDLTKGGLYYYIKGKKALLFAIMNFAIDLLEQELVDVLEEQDPERSLTLIIAGHVRVVIRDCSALSVLVYEGENLTAEHAAKIQERKEEYDSLLREAIRQVLDRSGNPGRIDPAVIADSLLGMMHWVVRWYRPLPGLDQTELIRQLTHFVLHGLLAPSLAR